MWAGLLKPFAISVDAGPDKRRPLEPIPEKTHTENVLLNATLDLSEHEIPTNAVLREVLRKKGFKATVVKHLFRSRAPKLLKQFL